MGAAYLCLNRLHEVCSEIIGPSLVARRKQKALLNQVFQVAVGRARGNTSDRSVLGASQATADRGFSDCRDHPFRQPTTHDFTLELVPQPIVFSGQPQQGRGLVQMLGETEANPRSRVS